MIEENKINIQKVEKSNYNLIDLGKNIIKTDYKKFEEKNLIIVGDKRSGKSTIFNTITQSSVKDSYTPTCGINFNYMRYQPSSSKKYVLNVHEIGGGIQNIQLIRSIINEKNIKNTIFIIVIDFSKPFNMINSIKEFTKEMYSIIKDTIDQNTLMDIIEGKKLKYKDINSNDFKRVNIFPGELIIVANKYDYLEKIDAEKIKWTCRTLRTFAHLNSFSLVYFKISETKLMKNLYNLVTSLSFGSNTDNISTYIQKDDIHPLFILYSNDSLEEIGDPKVIQQGGGRDLVSLWEDSFYSLFPNSIKEPKKEFNIIDENFKEKHIEPRIDEELVIFE